MRGAVEVWSLVTGRVVIPGEKQDQGWNAGHDGVCFGFVEFGPLSNIHVMTCSQGAKERSQAQRQGFTDVYPKGVEQCLTHSRLNKCC